MCCTVCLFVWICMCPVPSTQQSRWKNITLQSQKQLPYILHVRVDILLWQNTDKVWQKTSGRGCVCCFNAALVLLNIWKINCKSIFLRICHMYKNPAFKTLASGSHFSVNISQSIFTGQGFLKGSFYTAGINACVLSLFLKIKQRIM